MPAGKGSCLFPRLGADPEREEERQRDDEDKHTGREADVTVGVGGVVQRTRVEHPPNKQRKDGDARGGKKSEESRSDGEQQALKEAETLEWKPEDPAAVGRVI
jgi:hypothetical protein